MCWRAEYVLLILFSTTVDYLCARLIDTSTSQKLKKLFLALSLSANLGLLCFFKYLNFFGENVQYILDQFNIFYNVPHFDLLLPVGISFYTFQTISYTIDVYHGKIHAEKHFGIFAVYVSFFPQLVAGPIERGIHLLPQFRKIINFDYYRIRFGLTLILWGLFKKLVIADRLAQFINPVFKNPENHTGLQLLIATYAFAYQVFCDFSGYSDIAIGSAKVLGIDIMKNFNRPYFSKSPSEFWRRWHISLSTWLNDYVFVPFVLNIRKKSQFVMIIGIIITFFLSGLWHGASWTFIAFGLVHGFAIVLELITKRTRRSLTKRIPHWIYDILCVIFVFNFWSFSLVLWRSETFSKAMYIYLNLFNQPLETYFPTFLNCINKIHLALFAIVILEVYHYLIEFKGIGYSAFIKFPIIFRWCIYVSLTFTTIFFAGNSQEFIYFQF